MLVSLPLCYTIAFAGDLHLHLSHGRLCELLYINPELVVGWH